MLSKILHRSSDVKQIESNGTHAEVEAEVGTPGYLIHSAYIICTKESSMDLWIYGTQFENTVINPEIMLRLSQVQEYPDVMEAQSTPIRNSNFVNIL